MKDKLNSKIKFREGFRPFSPAILSEYQSEYFELKIPNYFMLVVAEEAELHVDDIPATVHIDQTARIQTVSEESNQIR